MSKRFIDVAAGLILRSDGQLLLAQRPGDRPWSGWWELPGGKLEPGETPVQALARELHEELGITVTQATPWVTYTHEYPLTLVRLAFHQVTAWEGEPQGLEGQALAWTDPGRLPEVGPLLPATRPPLRWLQLPRKYLLTSIDHPDKLGKFLDKLHAALASGIRLVQFREPTWAAGPSSDQLYQAFKRVLHCCRQHGAYCLVNSVHPQTWWEEADGVHLRASDAAAMLRASDAAAMASNAYIDVTNDPASCPALPGALRGSHYVAMSTHSADELATARRIRADFAVLGHVLDTPSHADKPGMGWEAFAKLNAVAGLPLFAIGGQTAATVESAQQHGAHGIAARRGLL